MTVPPDEERPAPGSAGDAAPGAPSPGAPSPGAPSPGGPAPGAPAPAYGAPGYQLPPDFDPYRFGKPDHPIPPEYAPPGYVPPQPSQPPFQLPSQPPPQYPYRPGPPPPVGAYGVGRPGNTKAVVSLVLGILAIVLFWTTVYDLLLIIPAIVLGALGRSDARRFPERGRRGVATGGLVCGIVAAALAVASTVYVYSKVRPCLDQFEPTSRSFQTCATDRLLGR